LLSSIFCSLGWCVNMKCFFAGVLCWFFGFWG
jgi:hypothetical protein